MREELDVAEFFSLGHHGAALLFNLLIAEARDDEERSEEYLHHLATWQVQAGASVAAFDLARLWALVPPSRVATSTRSFVEKWFTLVRASDERRLADDAQARELVRRRELRVKGRQRSRIASPFRVTWNGASGSARLDYRWGAAVQQIVLDVAKGRAGA